MEDYEVLQERDVELLHSNSQIIFSAQQLVIFTLLRNPVGKVVSISEIIDALKEANPTENPSVSSVKVQIHRIRKKIAAHYKIKTIWYSGYKMDPIRTIASS